MNELVKKHMTPEKVFMLSVMGVNGLNYLFNLIMGRMLGPAEFAEVALLITILLLFSFLATSFQVLTTKFVIEEEGNVGDRVQQFIIRLSILLGIPMMLLMYFGSDFLMEKLQTDNSTIFKIFSVGIPIYFIMSVNRGFLQGHQFFIPLSVTYVSEAIVKLGLSVLLIYWGYLSSSSVAVSIAILASLIVALIPFKLNIDFSNSIQLAKSLRKSVLVFFTMALLYELIQVLINSSDIIIVKMFYDKRESGLYSSLALIGRVVYFVTWMLVMLLMPKVIEKEKNKENSIKILLQYFVGIGLFTAVLAILCYAFSDTIVVAMFGKEYISIHPLLYQYAIATSFFALSNVLVYYALSLENYIPVAVALLFGALQIVLLYLFHESLSQVVQIQIAIMAIFLCITTLLVLIWKRKEFLSLFTQ